MLIDTHCHLDAPEFDGWRDVCVADARLAGVTRIVVPAVSRENFSAVLAMREQYGCIVALGLHPMYLAQHNDADLAVLADWLVEHQAQALGEIGLDGYDPALDMARQEALFAEQLRLARRLDLPVLLHVRRAVDLVLKHLRRIPVCGGIAHAFNGSEQQAGEFLKLGFKLGFGGAMTYQGSQRIRRLAATLPDEALVLETDAPDIRPAWAQDVPNRPANLQRFVQELAELRGQTFDDICRISTHNASTVLRLLDLSMKCNL